MRRLTQFTSPEMSHVHERAAVADSPSRVARETRKFAAVGRLLPGIAHELNTPTQYIGDNLRFLRDAFDQLARHVPNDDAEETTSPELAYLLEEIPNAIAQSLDGVAQATHVVDAMKRFAAAPVHDAGTIDVNGAVQGVVTLARNEWKYAAEVQCDLDPACPHVSCVEATLNQVALDLLLEAVRAIEADGTPSSRITVATRSMGERVELRVHVAGSACEWTLTLPSEASACTP